MAEDRWDPFKDLIGVQKRMNRLFESALTRATALEPDSPVGWRPAASVYETAEHVTIAVELVGLRREDITIEVSDGVLTVRGERQLKKELESNPAPAGPSDPMSTESGHMTTSFVLGAALAIFQAWLGLTGW